MLKGFASAFMVSEAIALYEVYIKFAMPQIDAILEGQPAFAFFYLIFPITYTAVVELIAYFKVLKPLSNEALRKQTVAKHWVNTLFLVSLVFGGFITTGGIVGIALLAILIVTLETQKE